MSEAKYIPAVCDYHGLENEPCYGDINEVFSDGKWITFCEGHQAVVYRHGAYVPKDPIRRIIFSQQNKRIRELESENETLWNAVHFADKKLQLLDVKEIEIPEERLEILF